MVLLVDKSLVKTPAAQQLTKVYASGWISTTNPCPICHQVKACVSTPENTNSSLLARISGIKQNSQDFMSREPLAEVYCGQLFFGSRGTFRKNDYNESNCSHRVVS